MARRVSALYRSRALAEEAAARLAQVVPSGERPAVSEHGLDDGAQPGMFDRLATMLVPDGSQAKAGYVVSLEVQPEQIDAAALALEDGAERVEVSAPARFSGNVVELSETAEELVVEKRAVLREEIILRVQATEQVHDIHETVRRTEVDIERFGPAEDRSSI